MPATSVLAFIVPRLVSQAENAVSDCLFYILSTYRSAADSLVRYLGSAGVALPVPLEFSTQVVWKYAGGRPDILGLSGDRAFLVFEAKFDAPLTKRQPVDYIDCLPEKAGRVLLFLAPADRIEEIWREARQRCVARRIRLGERQQCADGLSAATLWELHRFAVASWQGLLSTLGRDLSVAGDHDALADLAQLNPLCDRLLSRELHVFPPAGEMSDLDNRDRQLRAMADAITATLVNAGHASTKRYRATPGPGYYKRYMTLSGRKNWCVEFNTEYWARFGESLIWLSTNVEWSSAAEFAALDAMLANSARRLRGEFLIPLLARHAKSEAEALDQMTVQATAVARFLATLPSPTQESTPE